jgi:N-acetylmuramoyl-L-alanine amidase
MKKVKRDYRSSRKKIRWKIVLPLLVLSLLLSYIAINLIFPHKVVVVEPKYTVCDYSLSKAQAVFKTMQYNDTVELKEHLYYGETLNIYNESFELGKTDPFVGKTIILHNICDDTELVYMMESSVDRQIPLDALPVGFYEVYVMENLVKQRMISETVVYDQFYTVRRNNGLGKEVQVVADKDLIEPTTENTTIFDKNYVFIRVTDAEVPTEVYDIVIDPSRNHEVSDNTITRDVNVEEALVESANLLKTKLETYGLKVYVTRGDEIIGRYGDDGRMAKIYKVKAKYYIALDMDSSVNPSKKGASIYFSHYTTKCFASAIFESYLTLHDITIDVGSGTGLITKPLRDKMDSSADIRETGGKILGAAKYTGASSLNEAFAGNNPYGVQSVYLYMLYISSPYDYDIYTTQHDALIENIALGFADYLQLKKVAP